LIYKPGAKFTGKRQPGNENQYRYRDDSGFHSQPPDKDL
jgi:hypothetical protein